MKFLATLLGVLPFSLDVGGQKTRWVLSLGDAFTPQRLRGRFWLNGQDVEVPAKHLLRLWHYAPRNIERTYRQSALWKYISTYVPEDARYVDVGANIGGYLHLAKMRGMTTVGVEANPELGPELGSNEAAFGQVHTLALSDAEGSMPFHISDVNPGGSSLVPSSKGWKESGYDRTVEVEVTTFDRLFSEWRARGEVMHVVKIDVEGAEEAVVRGMAQSLSEGQIKAIWCEVRGPGSDRNPNSARAVSEFLESHGYRPFVFEPNAARPFEPFDLQSPCPQFFDLLFVRSLPEAL